jgi:spermidine/putrescine transport system ATP-binding protein
MADTIAVMNQGVIEQMGAPSDLYENPQTTFVANFLGQSNLIAAEIQGREAGQVNVRVQGALASIPAERAHAESGSGWLGIRPEKVLIAEAGEPIDAPGDVITGGYITDVSFVGVSTQYMVKMPWGQEVMVFEQNTGSRRMLSVGTKVDISWRPEYAFLLDASQDASAGIEED